MPNTGKQNAPNTKVHLTRVYDIAGFLLRGCVHGKHEALQAHEVISRSPNFSPTLTYVKV